MTGAAILACVVSLMFASAGPGLARRMPPAVATRVLVPASLIIVTTGVWVFIAVAFTWVAQLPPVSRYGDWSAQQVRETTPFPTTVAVGCGLLAMVAVGRTITIGTRRVRTLLAVRHSCRRLGAPGSLVVVEHDRPDAFATPGGTGRIVVTTGLLRALRADERRALLAHEASHLAHRHTWWILAADIAAAANPLLAPTTRAVWHAVERWADEDAAREVTDRKLVARTLARTALLTRGNPDPSVRLTATGGDVPGRVRALLGPPPEPRVVPLAALVALLVAATLAAGTVQSRGDALLDQAGITGTTTGH